MWLSRHPRVEAPSWPLLCQVHLFEGLLHTACRPGWHLPLTGLCAAEMWVLPTVHPSAASVTIQLLLLPLLQTHRGCPVGTRPVWQSQAADWSHQSQSWPWDLNHPIYPWSCFLSSTLFFEFILVLSTALSCRPASCVLSAPWRKEQCPSIYSAYSWNSTCLSTGICV